jgi:hypothetical protein
VRGLIGFVLVIVAGLGGMVRQARIQRDAVAAIEREGGGVKCSFSTVRVSPTLEREN